jgi:hypothetical protein
MPESRGPTASATLAVLAWLVEVRAVALDDGVDEEPDAAGIGVGIGVSGFEGGTPPLSSS